MDERWEIVDHYLEGLLVPRDEGLEATLRESATAGFPPIQVSPSQGRFLRLLVSSLGARRILEIGTLAGYSAIAMARALPPGGQIITLEADPRHAEVARANFERAGVAGAVEVRVGPALSTLPRLAAEHPEPFDFVFLDADRPHTVEYFDWVLRLTRPGSVLVVDNVVRQGAVADAQSTDENVRGMRRFLERLAREPRAEGIVLQTVGAKGYDGFAFVRLRASPDLPLRP